MKLVRLWLAHGLAQEITFPKTCNWENKCRFWPDSVFLFPLQWEKKLSGKRPRLAISQNSAPHHIDIIGSHLIVFSSGFDASSSALCLLRPSKDDHLFRVQSICMAEQSCLMTTKPQKFRGFQAECCFQRSGLSSQSWSLSTASKDPVTRYSPDNKRK